MGVSQGRSLLKSSLGVCILAAMLGKALSFTVRPTMTRGVPRLNVATIRDADFVERMVGGERYEMVPLPDSMVSQTVFVGNLGEFVTDDILSGLFQAVSKLQSVPACVARKPNMSSMQYGFVHFLTAEEKEVSSAPRSHPLLCAPTHMFVCRLRFFAFMEPSCTDVQSRWKRFVICPIRIASVCQERWSRTLAGKRKGPEMAVSITFDAYLAMMWND